MEVVHVSPLAQRRAINECGGLRKALSALPGSWYSPNGDAIHLLIADDGCNQCDGISSRNQSPDLLPEYAAVKRRMNGCEVADSGHGHRSPKDVIVTRSRVGQESRKSQCMVGHSSRATRLGT